MVDSTTTGQCPTYCYADECCTAPLSVFALLILCNENSEVPLHIYHSLCLPDLPVCLSAPCLSLCLSLSASVCLSARVCPYACLSVSLFPLLPLCVCLSVSVSFSLPLSLHLCLSVSLSLPLPQSLCVFLSVSVSLAVSVCLSLSLSLSLSLFFFKLLSPFNGDIFIITGTSVLFFHWTPCFNLTKRRRLDEIIKHRKMKLLVRGKGE